MEFKGVTGFHNVKFDELIGVSILKLIKKMPLFKLNFTTSLFEICAIYPIAVLKYSSICNKCNSLMKKQEKVIEFLNWQEKMVLKIFLTLEL